MIYLVKTFHALKTFQNICKITHIFRKRETDGHTNIYLYKRITNSNIKYKILKMFYFYSTVKFYNKHVVFF